MRKSDKKKNMARVNLLAENKYLDSKGLIKEDINELDIDTYANQMDTTGDYGQTTFSSKEPNKYDDPRQKGNKQKRVNALSKEGFEREFYKTYPVDVTKLVSETGTYFFKNIKWESNYSSYSLQFMREGVEDMLYIKSDTSSPKGYYIEFNKKPNLSPGAEELLRKMFSHNMNSRNNINEIEPTEQIRSGNPKFDLYDEGVSEAFKGELMNVMLKYLGQSPQDAGTTNDNRMFIHDNLMTWFNQSFPNTSMNFKDLPSLKLGKGMGLWTNKPQLMGKYAEANGINFDELLARTKNGVIPHEGYGKQ